MNESSAGHIRLEDNRVDLLTKGMIGQKGEYLVSKAFYDIHDEAT